MSAIFGALASAEEPLRPELWDGFVRGLNHRPANLFGRYQRPGLLLGVRAYSPTDLHAVGTSAAFVDPDTQLVCVLDGRLDYRADLCARLSFTLDSETRDEALIAAAYRTFGLRFCEMLEGDFAFALWDPHARRLVLARDPLGIRSLYFARVEQILLFASNTRALFAHPKLVRRANPLRIAAYLARDFPDTTATFFAGIERLSPGHLLVHGQGRTEVRVFHRFTRPEALRLDKTAAYTERFREIFIAAVAERTRGAGRLGLMLSGGLDSAGVLGALHRHLENQVLPCFSARFPDFPQIDEGAWLSQHDSSGRIERHEARADRIGPLDDLDRLHEILDEPFHAPNLFIYDALAKVAQSQGVHVVLDGLDGDTVVDHGLLFLNELLHRGRVRRLVRELFAIKRRAGLSLGSLMRGPLIAPDLSRMQNARLLLQGKLPNLALVTPEFARASGYLAQARTQAKSLLAGPSDFSALHLRAIKSPVLPFYFEIHDKLAASYGLDHRHPYFDRRLVEFCLALPAEQRLFDGWDRAIQRRAFKGLVPESIRVRQSKSVWTPNFQRQLLIYNGETIRDTLALSPHPLEGIADLRAVRKLGSGLRPGADPSHVIALWAAVTLTRWLVGTQVTV